jgi:hypothetical protein
MEFGSFLILQFLLKSNHLKCFMVLMELGNTSKHESLKSRTRMYLNLEMHASTKDSEEGPSPSIGEKMVRILFDFCKHFKTFSFCQVLSIYEKCQTFFEMFWV